jgi:hypothetical protein
MTDNGAQICGWSALTRIWGTTAFARLSTIGKSVARGFNQNNNSVPKGGEAVTVARSYYRRSRNLSTDGTK